MCPVRPVTPIGTIGRITRRCGDLEVLGGKQSMLLRRDLQKLESAAAFVEDDVSV